jgi:2-keto-4-pentenoate hydratase/2-oxohepta-3-ene-1,7-dioic acid hydratase in catechol pathway
MGMADPTWLKVGDVITLGVTGLGEQRNSVIEAP